MIVLSESSLKRLVGVHPKLVACVRRAAELSAQDFAVACGLRTLAEEKEMVARGTSTTLNSQHIPQADHLGHAVDLVPFHHGALDWDWSLIWPIAEAVRHAAQEQSLALRWGGAWDVPFTASTLSPKALSDDYSARRKSAGKRVFLDGPHFELATA